MARPKKDFPSSKQTAGKQTEWKGGHCGVHQPGTFVAKTQAEWKQLWDATMSNTFPAPEAPKLPKGKMAVGIFTGQASSPSDISVTDIASANGTTTVNWRQEHHSTMLAVMFEPYLLKLIDKTDDTVAFAKQQPGAKPAIDLKTLKPMNKQ